MAIENLAGWNFDVSYARLPNLFFTSTRPTPVALPKLVIFNSHLAKNLGLHAEELEAAGIGVFAGNQIPEGAFPLAQAYAGHQFGHFTMLGDGRAVLLGEHITQKGERFDIQLKGSGKTPYSRGGDGRAVLGPMLREYIISEAMHALKIPTTRSLAVVLTGEPVLRETVQSGAVLTRTAASHLRVGTFQYAAKWGTMEELRILADYAIKRHYPSVEMSDNRYLAFLKAVITKQAELIAKWQLVGFVHGVMNTDNMTISGETIDYGPCAFMDTYDQATFFSSIDRMGRYAYGNQPNIGAWDLARFAETLLPLLSSDEEEAIKIAEEAVAEFGGLFQNYYLQGMRAKLGLFHEESQDEMLIKDLLSMMQKYQADYTNTFVSLTFDTLEYDALFAKIEFKAWYERWRARVNRQEEPNSSVVNLMRESNPMIIPRNHQVEAALEVAAGGDYSVMHKLLEVLSTPYELLTEYTAYSAPPEPSACRYQTFCGT